MHFISEFVDNAVKSVYSTMLSVDVETVARKAGSDIPAVELMGLVGSVSFAGKITGTLYMSYSEALACAVTERLLGDAPGSVDDPEVADVIGEIANMTSGDVTRQSSAKGYGGYLAPPMVMQGESIIVEPKGAPIALFNLFKVGDLGGELGVRVFAKLQD